MAFIFTEEQEKWLQALESGEWRQGRRYLWAEVDGVKSYCCLGVAGKLFAPRSRHMSSAGGRSLQGLASPKVVRILRLRTPGGRFREGTIKTDFGKFGWLTFMNDYGVPFPDIAAFIRANPEQVFTGGASE